MPTNWMFVQELHPNLYGKALNPSFRIMLKMLTKHFLTTCLFINWIKTVRHDFLKFDSFKTSSMLALILYSLKQARLCCFLLNCSFPSDREFKSALCSIVLVTIILCCTKWLEVEAQLEDQSYCTGNVRTKYRHFNSNILFNFQFICYLALIIKIM